MRDLGIELKQLRLHGMAGAWIDLVEQGSSSGADGARWLLVRIPEHRDRSFRPNVTADSGRT